MSLEAEIKELREALQENSELLRAITAKASANLKSDAKPAAKEDDGDGEKETTRGRGRGRPAGSKNKEKAPTAAKMKEEAQSFIDGAESDEDYAERREALKKLTKKYEAPKYSEIAEEDRAAALADLLELKENWGKEEEPPRRRRGEDDDDV